MCFINAIYIFNVFILAMNSIINILPFISANLIINDAGLYDLVHFDWISVIECVLKKPHETLGKGVTVIKDWLNDSTFKKADRDLHLPISIPISHSRAHLLKDDIKSLQTIMDDLKVTVAMDDHGAIVVTPSHLTRDDWKALCRERIDSYMNDEAFFAPISHEALHLLIPTIMNMQKSEKSFSYNPPVQGQGSPLHHFEGHPNVIQKIRCELENINAQLKVTTVQVCLDEMKFAFVVQLKQQDISSACPSVEVQFNPPNAVTLRGTLQDIHRVKNLFTSIVCISTEVDLKNQRLFKFICTDSGKSELKAFISNQNKLSAAVYVTTTGQKYNLKLLSEPMFEQLTKTIADTIPAELCCKLIPIGTLYDDFHSDKQWYADYNELCKQQSHVFIETTRQGVQVIGFKDKVENCFSILNAFIEKRFEQTKTVIIEFGVWRLFKGPLLDKWNSLVSRKGSTDDIQITNPQGNVIQFRGRNDAVERWKKKLKALVESVIVKQEMFTKPDIKKYLMDEANSMMIRGVESVCIELDENRELLDFAHILMDEHASEEANYQSTEILTAIRPSCPVKQISSLPNSGVKRTNSAVTHHLDNLKFHKGSLLDVKVY